MRASKLGRWAGRAAVVLVLGFGAATVGGGAVSADSSWEVKDPGVSPVQPASVGAGQNGLATPNDSSWE
jgi:hypothetical protein